MVKGQNIFFSESSHVACQIKGNGTYSTLQAHILSFQNTSTPDGVKNSNIFFLKVVMLHIKLKGIEHDASTYTVLTHIIDPWVGVKGLNIQVSFLKVVMLHIKLMGMKHRAPCKHIFCPYKRTRPIGWCHAAYQIKEKGTKSPCMNILCPYTLPQPPDGVKNVKQFCSERRDVAYQIKGNGT